MENFHAYKVTTGVLAGLFVVVIGMAVIGVSGVASYFSFFLCCFLSLPIFIVAFGWGTLASFVSLISATIILIITTNIYIGFGSMLLFFLPAVYASWLLGLARPSHKEDTLIWYPLSSVIFHSTNFIALTSSLIGFYIQVHPSTPVIAKKITAHMIQAVQQSQSVKGADILAFSELLMTHTATLAAIALTVYSLIFLIGNLYFSMIAAQRMKWLRRPPDDWGHTFRLPILGLAIFIFVCAASMIELGFILNLSTRAFATAYTVSLSISGLAYLHDITKGVNGRIVILSLVYISILTVIFAPPVFFMTLLMGIWSTIQYHLRSHNKFH
ncbi:hypothetical protein [Bartonella sp. CB178]|uniref:hypothetical protein n=1 Tax=Bartonella sp. CB178 TaxID=3112255 RepID=UPI00300DE220